jgi:ABC-type multidrug transport system ATPase subunit
MQSCLEVRSLACQLGSRAALHNVNFVVAPGQVHGLLGPRWAGKTTLLRVLAGELDPSAGSARMPARVAFVREEARTPIEARLDPGTRQRIALARAVESGPDVLLVDEPAGGFDQTTEAATRTLVSRYAAQGGSVVWATRRLDVLLGLAAGVTLLTDGRVRYEGGADVLAARTLSAFAGASAAPLHRAA